MKNKSFSQLPLKRHQSNDSLKLSPMINYIPNSQSKQQTLTARKTSINKTKQKIIERNASAISHTPQKIIYNINKEIDQIQSIRKGGSVKNINKTNNRPLTSMRSAQKLPKLINQRKRQDDGILILSQMPSQFLIKRQDRIKTKSLLNKKSSNNNHTSRNNNNDNQIVKKEIIGLPLSSDNNQQKKKKFRLKANFNEQLLTQLKRTFTLKIINGVLQLNTPQMINFKQIKIKDNNKITKTIRCLSNFIRKYNLQDNYQISYYGFCDLISKLKPSNKDIINTLIENQPQNLTQQLLKIPGSEYLQEDGEHRAVLKIQSFFKMWQERRQYIKYQYQLNKIKYIQSFWKRKYEQNKFKIQIKNIRLQKIEKFKSLQQSFKQNWYMIKMKKRWEIHIPNLGTDEFTKLTTDKLIQHQCSEILRIFKIVHNFLVNIIFVSPVPLNQEVKSYYQKVLEINHMMEYRERIKFVYPQNYHKFSGFISTQRLLIESPIALKKIKQIINDCPAYIVSGQNSSNSDIHLSLELKIPLFGTLFNSQIFSAHSEVMSFFRQNHLPTTLMAKDIYDENELINTLGILMFNNMDCERWIIKIDDEYDQRGDATVVISSFPMVKALLKSFQQIINCDQAYDLETDIIKALTEQLKQNNHKKIKINNKRVYRNSQQYFKHLKKKGIVIEKYIQGEQIQMSFVIYPDKQVQIIHASTLIKSGGKVILSVSPIKQQSYSQCQYTVKSVSKQLIKRNMFGNFSLTIVHSLKQDKFYCTGMKNYLNSFISHNHLSKMISNNPNAKESQNYTIYCPILIHQPLKTQSIKQFFQKSRFANIEYDVKTKEGIMFLPLDTLQSQCIGVMTVAETYYLALFNLLQCCEFLISQFGEGNCKKKEARLSVSAIKSKVKSLLNQLKIQTKPEPGNLQWLF